MILATVDHRSPTDRAADQAAFAREFGLRPTSTAPASSLGGLEAGAVQTPESVTAPIERSPVPTPEQMAVKLHEAIQARDQHTVASPDWWAANRHVDDTFERLCLAHVGGVL